MITSVIMFGDDIHKLLSSITPGNSVETNFYKCPFCFDIYDSSNYKDHINKCERHKQPRYVCFLCPKTFLDMTEYKKHQHEHLGIVGGKQCNKCYKILCSKYYAEIHQKKCNGLIDSIVPEYHCQRCNRYFINKAKLNRHLISCKNEMLFSQTEKY